jgi:hypothetical protein
MRRFLGSAWFPFLASIILAGVTVVAYALLKPTGEDVGNEQVVQAFRIAGWAAGPVAGLLSLLLMLILNGIRRLLRLRSVGLLHPVVVLLGVLPWLLFSWQLTGEPPFTAFARAAIPFVGRPMLWGALAACAFTLLLSLPLLLPAKRNP